MPQTKRQIEAMLAEAEIRPNRRLGQNFLIDGNLMRKLVASAEIAPDDVVLEVGAGTGSLTEMLLEEAAHVVAVEVDPRLYELLDARLGSSPRLTLLGTDALADKNHLSAELVDALRRRMPRPAPSAPRGGRLLLVANLPYHIASPLMVDLLLSGLGLCRMCFTVQKEVAERITSPPGRKTFGPLSVAVQAFCDVVHITDLAASVFWPRPQVASSMLRVDWNAAKAARIADPQGFNRVVRSCFLHRRKKLAHALAYLLGVRRLDGPPAEAFARYDLSRRPEQLGVEEWIALAESVAALRADAPAVRSSAGP
ncbi:MAG: 16S rRNA (adenine(1518)-N(6)/adenine(1519)-N(6))-dimethyltransferase RsmA [Phycisphaerae bacterium]